MFLEPARQIAGSLRFPGDKSISHRLVLISLLLDGSLELTNLSDCVDVATSLKLVEKLGIAVRRDNNAVRLKSRQQAITEFSTPVELDCGNSGTTARLLAGVLAGQPGSYLLTGDASLSRRPMLRVVEPLRQRGAKIECADAGTLPIRINGQPTLTPAAFFNRHSSAQVKSALLLAGLRATGSTVIEEPFSSRDHTERLLSFLGADISQAENRISLNGPFRLAGAFSFTIPGDVSSAAFFAVAAATFPGSRIELKNILLNPGRTGFFNVLKRMGTGVSFNEQNDRQNEPVGTAVITGGTLHGVEIVAAEIPSLIDELPALAVAMAFANGPSQVTGASELRRKETDRISNLISQLQKAGVKCQELPDGFRIEGNSRLTEVIAMEPADDHRLAMAFAILACRSEKGLFIKNPDCVKISFPDFFNCLQNCVSS